MSAVDPPVHPARSVPDVVVHFNTTGKRGVLDRAGLQRNESKDERLAQYHCESAELALSKEIIMRLVVPLSLLVMSAAGLAAMTAPAAAQDRYCLQGRGWGYPGDCAFATYGQCEATASGTNAGCGINPRYAYARQRGYWGGPGRRY